MRVLLINPRLPESFWSFRWALERVLPGKRSLNPPLGLATIAALCPPDPGWRSTRRVSVAVQHSRAMSPVPSVDPSSTTMTSKSGSDPDRDAISARSAAALPASFRIGITIESSGIGPSLKRAAG